MGWLVAQGQVNAHGVLGTVSSPQETQPMSPVITYLFVTTLGILRVRGLCSEN